MIVKNANLDYRLVKTPWFTAPSGEMIDFNLVSGQSFRPISSRGYRVKELNTEIYRVYRIVYLHDNPYCVAGSYGGFIVSQISNKIINSYISPSSIIFNDCNIINSEIIERTFIRNCDIVDSSIKGKSYFSDCVVHNSNIFGNEHFCSENFIDEHFYIEMGDKIPLKYTLIPFSPNVYQLKSFKQFGDVSINELGGFIDITSYLSHEDDCWIYDSSRLINHSQMSGSSKISQCSIADKETTISNHCVAIKSFLRQSSLAGKAKTENSRILNTTMNNGFFKDACVNKGIKQSM